MAYGKALTWLFPYHVAAVQLIAPDEAVGRDFSIQTTTLLTRRAFMMMKDAVRERGRAIVAIMYDVAEDVPALTKVWIMMPTTDPAVLARGDELTLLIDCALWAPVGDGPIVIVVPKTYGGHFAVSADGMRLERHLGRPARQLAAGLKRAEQRIARAARSGRIEARKDTTLLITA